MNVQDAIGILSSAIESNTQNVNQIDAIRQFANEAEATLAEHLGQDNESVGQLGMVSNQAETAGGVGRQFAVEMEHLQEILQAIQ